MCRKKKSFLNVNKDLKPLLKRFTKKSHLKKNTKLEKEFAKIK